MKCIIGGMYSKYIYIDDHITKLYSELMILYEYFPQLFHIISQAYDDFQYLGILLQIIYQPSAN